MFTEMISNPGFPLRDLFDVGVTKALGYLPTECIAKLTSVDELIKELSESGRLYLKAEHPKIEGGVLFVFDPQMLRALLQKYSMVLQIVSWPTDEKEFVERVAIEAVKLESPVFDVISLAYGNDPQKVKEEIQAIHERTWENLVAEMSW